MNGFIIKNLQCINSDNSNSKSEVTLIHDAKLTPVIERLRDLYIIVPLIIKTKTNFDISIIFTSLCSRVEF